MVTSKPLAAQAHAIQRPRTPPPRTATDLPSGDGRWKLVMFSGLLNSGRKGYKVGLVDVIRKKARKECLQRLSRYRAMMAPVFRVRMQ
jgi:hypothetical protein